MSSVIFFSVPLSGGFCTVQLLSEEYSGMSPGTLESQGLINQSEYQKYLTLSSSPETHKKLSGESVFILLAIWYLYFRRASLRSLESEQHLEHWSQKSLWISTLYSKGWAAIRLTKNCRGQLKFCVDWNIPQVHFSRRLRELTPNSL